MAILDFKCKDCGEKFFEIVSSSNKDKLECPNCKSKKIVQIFEGKSYGAGASKGSSGYSPIARGG